MKHFLIQTSSLLAIAATTQATVLSSWTYDNASNGNFFPIAATEVAAGVSASVSLGAGLSHPNWLNNDGILAVGADQLTLAGAISGNDFFSFSISGPELSFDSMIAYAASQTDTGRQFFLFSDKTGFAEGDQLSSITYAGPGFAGAQGTQWTADLSGVTALQGITGSVEFRVYSVSTTANASTFLGFRETAPTPDIQFLGAVPEPSVYAAMLGLTALGCVILRRRKR